jgi:signal transduction histidine kinase
MKRVLLFQIIILLWLSAFEQNMDVLQVDKLQKALLNAKEDTTRALILTQLAEAYRDRITDTSFNYAQNALELSRQINYPRGESKALIILSYYFYNRGNLTQGLELGLKALDITRKYKLYQDQPYAMVRLGNIYMSLRNYKEALSYYHQSRDLSKNSTDTFIYAVSFWRAADAYYNMDMTDSALFNAKKAEDIAKTIGNNFVQIGVSHILGNVYAKRGDDELALQYYRKNQGGLAKVSLASYFRDQGMIDSAIFYAERAYDSSVKNSARQLELTSSLLLTSLYESKEPQKALHYLKIAMNAKDSLYGAEKVVAVTSVAFKEKERENEIRNEQMAFRNSVKLYATLTGLILVIIIALLLLRNIKHQRSTNLLLQQQKNDITKALSDLKATQSQLIQSEKMASLGELTAGIAHEIQNPLNFVNNFSEVNKELLLQLKDEIKKGNLDEVNDLANDVISNEEKINNHGKRADAIVKGMLQHSQVSSGVKEPTDINALAVEYLKLAYHGQKAKDKYFDATLKNDYDPSAGQINIIPQDIGRVLLNLYNNAFYAVAEKKKSSNEGFEPVVTITTKKLGNGIEVRVKDNGNGIPPKILDKIFQPFFTTKPTGQGTGLGLSLSYDIVKAHGGEIKAESNVGEGTEFIIQLPNS